MEYQDLRSLSRQTSISVSKLRDFVRMGMPHFRVGRKILVNPDEFRAWFERGHRARPKTEITTLDLIISETLSEIQAKSP